MLVPVERSLSFRRPDLAKEWHPTKNGSLKPEDVTYSSAKIVWWLRPYDDLRTGKHFDFEWQASVNARSAKGRGCPYLCNQAVWPGYNDLKSCYPELMPFWDFKKNSSVDPGLILFNSNLVVWWIDASGASFQCKVVSVVKGFYKDHPDRVIKVRSDAKLPSRFVSLVDMRPDLAFEWHPTKNGNLKPDDVACESNKKVWWWQPYDDPETGKHFDFEWEARIQSRVHGDGNPYLAKRNAKCWSGFNDLLTKCPDVVRYWDYERNGNVRPEDVCASSNQFAYIVCDVNGFLVRRYLSVQDIFNCLRSSSRFHFSVSDGNDLMYTHPEYALFWDTEKNGDLTPHDVTAGSHVLVWWKLPWDNPLDGKHYELSWRSRVEEFVLAGKISHLKSQSKGEYFVYEYLKEKSFDFDREVSFDDLVGVNGGLLRYDFVVRLPGGRILCLEYNGEQHYFPVSMFGGEAAFDVLKKHDSLKRSYARFHGWYHIEIPYMFSSRESIREYLNDVFSEYVS